MARARNVSSTTVSDGRMIKEKYKYIEFKHLYFKLQKLIDKKVILSLKYEQMKTPEIHSTLIKPITTKIIDIASVDNIKEILNKYIPIGAVSPDQTPKFGPQLDNNGPSYYHGSHNSKVSTFLVYIMLLLRYEYMIQSENNLIRFDLLVTKANLCEILAIRMLREYKSFDRINLLFINPMKNNYFADKFHREANLSNYYKPFFNTIELSILSKSKKFLSQPIVIHILDRFYNGELIIKDYGDNGFYDEEAIELALGYSIDTHHEIEEQSLIPQESNVFNNGQKVLNYKFNKISIDTIIMRANIVPKYQSLVVNLKHFFLTMLYLYLIINNKNRASTQSAPLSAFTTVVESFFWLTALSLNFEFLIKIINIEYKFLKKIIWTYIDMILLILINGTFLLRVLKFFGRVSNSFYYDIFSLISIIMFPRMLSIFNNYEFFHMIILSLKKMLWNMIGMFCLFISMIFGFYLCFISLTINRTNYDIAFDMLKVFFGFTPAVWSNWGNYNKLGKAIQMCYLFLIQFVIGTILAIVLGNIFAKINQSNKEEFEYFKTTNLIIYLKWGNSYYYNLTSRRKKTQHSHMSRYRPILISITQLTNNILKIFKFPIILFIFFYEIIVKNKIYHQQSQSDLKNFTFLDKDLDYYGDNDMIHLYRSGVNTNDYDDDSDMSILLMKTRNNSLASPSNVPHSNNALASYRKFSQLDSNNNFSNNNQQLQTNKPNNKNGLVQVQSIYTLGNFRSASTDSLFIDEVLNKKYGGGSTDIPVKKTYNSSSGGSGNSASTIIANMPPIDKIKTNNSELSRTPLGIQSKIFTERIISLLNMNDSLEDYQEKKRKRTYRTRVKPKSSNVNMSSSKTGKKSKKKKELNDEIMNKLSELESLVEKLIHHNHVEQEYNHSILQEISKANDSNSSIIVNEGFSPEHSRKHDEVLSTPLNRPSENYSLQLGAGLNQSRKTSNTDSNYNYYNGGNIYNIAEVSLDDIVLLTSTRQSSAFVPRTYNDIPSEIDEISDDTEAYDSDETF